MRSKHLSYLLKIIVLAATYFVAAKVGLAFSSVGENVTLLWPPAGIAMAALLLFGYRLWPGVVIGAFLATASTGVSPGFALITAIGNPLEALVGTYLLRRVNFDNALSRVYDVVNLIFLGAALSSVISATIGGVGMGLTGLIPWPAFFSAWWVWWLGDAMGILVITPILLTWGVWPGLAGWPRWQLVETIVLLLVTVIVAQSVFGDWFSLGRNGYSFAYFPFPVLIWAAFRFGSQGAATANLLFNAIAVWNTVRGVGPFAGASVHESLFLGGIFMSVASATALFLAAIIAEHRQAEQALQVSETRYRSVVTALSEGIMFQAATGEIITCNHAAEKILGLSFEQMIGRTSQDPRWRAIHEDGSPFPGEAHPAMSTLETGEPQRNIIMGVHKPDNTLTWISINSQPIFTKDGTKPSAVVTSFTDITQQRQAGLALRQSEQFLQSTLDALLAHIAVIDETGMIIMVNAAWRCFAEANHFLGPDYGLNMNYLEICDTARGERSEEASVAAQGIREVMTTKQDEFYLEYPCHGPEKQQWFAMRVTRFASNGLARAVIAHEEITKRKWAEKALQESERNLLAAQRIAHLGSWEMDVATGISHWSDEFFRICGYEPGAFQPSAEIGLQIIHPEDRESTIEMVRATVEENKPYYIEKRIVRPSGEIRYVLGQGELIHDENKQPVKLIGSFLDITDRKQAEEKLHQLNEALEQRVAERTAELQERVSEVEQLNQAMFNLMEDLQAANRSLEQTSEKLQQANAELETFAYSVSHDLKAPLRGIDGYSRLLLEDYADQLDEEGQRCLRTIRHAAGQMTELIDALLAYARLERRSFTTGQINLQALVEALLAERAEEIQARQVEIIVNIPCQTVSGDAEGLAQALRNLIENALKFTRAIAKPCLEIGGFKNENKCIIWVRDNGIGFDMRYHDRIFEIFQRLQRVEEYPGTGIGLALVSKAMQRMGGRIWAESEPGKGATFYLELPQAENAAS